MSIYDYKVKEQSGAEVSLKEYEGNVVLIINSATECGFTPQYDELQKMYEEYKDKGFTILDFPCNQFGNQAPGSDQEISSFCSMRYGITFPVFSKIEVNGENAIPLYQYLVKEKGFAGFDEENDKAELLHNMMSANNPNYQNEPDIKWNFTKFLIDRNGTVVERFEPTADFKRINEKVKELL